MNNLTISSWAPLANISGSIRGYVAESDKNLEVKGSRSNIELNFDSISSFIQMPFQKLQA